LLEGWEWIIIIGGIAFTMVVVLIIALLFFLTRQKTNTPQGYTHRNNIHSNLSHNTTLLSIESAHNVGFQCQATLNSAQTVVNN
jgi:hypothetical protein